jgi:hypothetical protein
VRPLVSQIFKKNDKRLITLTTQDFDHEVMSDLKLLDAGPEGTVEYSLYISEFFSNLNGRLLHSI